MYRTIHADGSTTTPSPFPAGVPVGTGKGVVKPEDNFSDEDNGTLELVQEPDLDAT